MSSINVKLGLDFEFIPKEEYDTYRGDKLSAVASFGGDHLISGDLLWDENYEEYTFYPTLAHASIYIGHWEEEIGEHKLWFIKITPIVVGEID